MKHSQIDWDNPDVQEFLQLSMGELIEEGLAVEDEHGLHLTPEGEAFVDAHILRKEPKK